MSSKTDEIHRAIEHLQRLTELFRKRRTLLAEGVGLTEQQWEVLEQISTEHFMPSMFARKRESSAAAVSKTIRQLVEKELVSVSLNEVDARQRNYGLTVKGRRVMAKLRKSRAQAIEQVWMQLDTSELDQFSKFAKTLGDSLERLINTN